MMERRRRKWMMVAIAGVLSTYSAAVFAGTWYDSFDDGVVDLTNYEINLGVGGVCTVEEVDNDVDPPENLGFASVFTNSPGGSYVLTAVKVEPGDTVRTVFRQSSAWNAASISAIGLTYDLTSTRYLDTSVACFFLQQQRNNVLAYRHVGFIEELVGLDNAGDPEQQTWVYEMVVGPESGGSFDVTLTVYDLDGTQRGDSATLNTMTPTGDMYWFVGDNRTLDYVFRVEIGQNLDPIGPENCQEVTWGDLAMEYDLNQDCYVELMDFALLTEQWQACIEPTDDTCDHPWVQ